MAVWQLDDELWFPNPRWGVTLRNAFFGESMFSLVPNASKLALIHLAKAMQWYAFQMEREPHWYCPLDRYVIIPEEIHVSHSMRQLLRQQRYEVTVNQDFEGVINGCSKAQGRNEENGAWLGPDIIEAFTSLHRLGHAASVEVWESVDTASGKRLVGGLYGVTLRNAFFGESMFSLVPNASKLALIHLAKAMQFDRLSVRNSIIQVDGWQTHIL